MPASPDASPEADAYARALRLLARREHSRHELHEKLGRGGLDRDAIEAALNRLAEEGAQSDRRFAAALVRVRIGQGRGPLRIRAELATHALPAELVEDALAEGAADHDWLELARVQLHKRFGTRVPASWPERAKRMQFLQRRGFPANLCSAALRATGGDED